MYLVSIILMYTIHGTEIDHMPYSFIEFQWFVVSGECKRSRHILSLSILLSGHLKKIIIIILSVSTRTESNILASELFPRLWGVSKWLVESLPMIMPIPLAFGTSLRQVMTPIRNCNVYEIVTYFNGCGKYSSIRLKRSSHFTENFSRYCVLIL